MGRMLDALKQIDQKRGKSDTTVGLPPRPADPYTTQPLPSTAEVAAAEASLGERPPAERPPTEELSLERSPAEPPPTEDLPLEAAGILTEEEIRSLAGSEPGPSRTVDELEREMRELEDLLTLERQTDQELLLGLDPVAASPRRVTEVVHAPAEGVPFSQPSEPPAPAAHEEPTPVPADVEPSPSQDPPLAFDDPETDLMHFELMEQALRGQRDADAAAPFAVFPPALEELPAQPDAAADPAHARPAVAQPAAEPTVAQPAELSAPVDLLAAAPPDEPAHEVLAPSTAGSPPGPVPWAFLETPLQREDHDRFARQIGDQLPRSLPASLMLAAAGRQGGRRLAVCGLARALAERDEGTVLLIDADPAGREITSRLGLARAPGWSEALAAPATAQTLAVPTDFAGLAVLPAGRGKAGGRPSPEAVRNLLAELKRGYRYIIAEAGSTMAASDALAQVCDAVFLLVELGVTGRADARRAARRLKQRGASLRGCVLTGLSPSEAALFRPSALPLAK